MPPRVYVYRIDFEGRILHAGSELHDPAVIRQLLTRVERDASGGLHSWCAGERNELDPADAPYVITSFAAAPSADDPGHLPVTCQGGLARLLDLGTLRLREQAFLYGLVEGGLAARFGRQAWLDFASRFVDASVEPPVACLGGCRWPITIATGT